MTQWMRLLAAAALIPFFVLPGQVLSRPTVQPAQARPTRLVLMVMDGFRPDYLTLAPMRHLHSLISAGMTYSNAWVGQLETQTPTGHATIATGVYPRKHGVIGFVWRDPTGQNITWMPTDDRQLNAGNMERLIEAGGVPSISDLIHQTYAGSRTASISGEKVYAADAMGVGADYIVWGNAYGPGDKIIPTAVGKHVPPANSKFKSLVVHASATPEVQDHFAARMAVQLLHTVHPRALLINFPGADIEGHRDGGVIDPSDMRDTIRALDGDIGKVISAYKRAGLYQNTLFVVTADHGMVPNSIVVPKQKMYDAVRATGALWLEDDFLGSAGYVFLRNPDDAQRVATALAGKRFKGVEGALYKTTSGGTTHFVPEQRTAASLGPEVTQVYEDLADTLAAPNGPEIVLPFKEDALGVTPKGQGRRWGTHGGLSWRVQHIPLILSGPGVRRGTSTFPAKLVDVAPTIERLMGLSVPSGVDGVVLNDALSNQVESQRASETAVTTGRLRDITALERLSVREHGLVLTQH